MPAQEGHNVPRGRGAVGVEVARDFGEDNGGLFFGKVTSVSGVKRPVYKVLYTDGDGEDLDADQYEYAFSFAARQRGTKLPEDSSDDENGNTARGKGDSMAATASTSPPAAFPTWNNVGKGKKFKPVVSRVNAEAEKTRPKFYPPCRETQDISPGSFGRVYLSDDLVDDIAKYSEQYRQTCAVRLRHASPNISIWVYIYRCSMLVFYFLPHSLSPTAPAV